MERLAVAAAIILASSVAGADEPGLEHLERAERAEAAGDYVVAETEYIAAYDALKDPRLFYYIARAYEAEGKAETAAVYYRRYLDEVEVPEQHRHEIQAKIDQLDPPPEPEPEPDPWQPRPPAPSSAPLFLRPPGATLRAPTPAIRDSHTPTKKHWYGWQIMLSDVTTVVLAAKTESAGVFVAGYLAGPMFIHGMNGNGGKALGSPLLRVGLPVAGGLLGAAVADCPDGSEFCGLGEVILGVGAGALTSLIIDWSWAKKKVEIPGTVTVGRCQGTTRCTTLGYAMTW